MNQSNPTLAKRIADLERQLSSTKTVANTLLEENKQLLIELASVKDLLESSMLSEATAKQYTEEVDKQNQALAAQVEMLRIAALNAVQSMSGGEAKADLRDAYDATPAACLAQVRAEAGRAGFVAGYMLCNDGSPLIKHNYEGFADQYAEQIRREVE